ncbi:hypothetical protein C4K03_2460 [Pseudomonas synxantha]|uniref:Lipoprotein n=1 Tax=Pseudomonas synxantha TaxID=47883 RepID=A0A3G7U5P0_9PSED|nr:hypothetical protein [Pseudomonas synxantha]AZE54615.1 hypothetical protein C4K03_2460 [Pseudomonas synxantha]
MKKWTTPLMLALPLALTGCTAAPSIPVAFGSPTYVHRLTYDTLYSAKPFTEATLYYYDNGTYKIISPGEEHYGVYVVKGDFDAPRYAITYISLPSTDWYGNVALHELLFDAGSGKFGQQALLPSDQYIPPQDGQFVLERNSIDDPRPLRWPAN